MKDIGGVPKMGVPQNGWFYMQHSIKMDDSRVPHILGSFHMGIDK